MNFAEEKTPAGLILKVMFNKMKYLVFNNRGESISSDSEGRSLLHKMPSIVFLGTTFEIERDYEREFSLLKIRDNHLIVPYRNIIEKKKKYIFINLFAKSDMVPASITHVKGYSTMLKEIPSGTEIDYLIVDETLSETEVSVIASRFKPMDIIYISSQKKDEPEEVSDTKETGFININTMSDNAVFLASYHLRNMALSNLNQLLLDFDISAFDTQYIIYLLNDILMNRTDENEVLRNMNMLIELKNSFEFYLALIERDGDTVKELLQKETDYRKLAPYRTLVSKVSSMNPGREGQLLYTEYENLVMDRLEELKSK
jgi:transposase-like protein